MSDNTDNLSPETETIESGAADALAQAAQANSTPSLEDFRPTEPGNINPEVLQNIMVTLSIEVGRAQIKIKDLMRLSQGSVVELDRIAGEPLDLLINNSVVAQGEIVLVNDRYGVRLTRVVPSSERLKSV